MTFSIDPVAGKVKSEDIRGKALTMKFELNDEDLPLIIRTLDHYYACTRAVQRDDRRYKILAERLSSPSRKQVVIEQGPSKSKNAGRNQRRTGWVN